MVSRIRGNVDLLPQSELLFEPGNAENLVHALNKSLDPTIVKVEIARNQQMLRQFDMNMVVAAMKNIYLNVMDESGRVNGEDAG